MILNDTEIWSLSKLGFVLYMREHHEEAAAIFRGLLHLQPRLPYSWYVLGLIRRDQGDAGEAAQALKHALSCDAEFWAARVVLAELFYQNGRPGEALTILKPILGARRTQDATRDAAIRRGRALWKCWQRGGRLRAK
ncbi:tetratricopeptide repeat protein [Bradymonas sediminis]|nr:tetratricopeptide repeat protein [Bradymonas sediminis]TDP75273.1 tetratricopeptide repeat protein [Bradymonas sediminis]